MVGELRHRKRVGQGRVACSNKYKVEIDIGFEGAKDIEIIMLKKAKLHRRVNCLK